MKYLFPSGVNATSHPGGKGMWSRLGRSSRITSKLPVLWWLGAIRRLGLAFGNPTLFMEAGQDFPRKCTFWGGNSCEPSILLSRLWLLRDGSKKEAGKFLLSQLDWPPLAPLFIALAKSTSSSCFCLDSGSWWTTWFGPVCVVICWPSDILKALWWPPLPAMSTYSLDSVVSPM